LLFTAPTAVEQICEYFPEYEKFQGIELISEFEKFLKVSVLRSGIKSLQILKELFPHFRSEKRLDLIELGIRKIRLFLVCTNNFDEEQFSKFLEDENSKSSNLFISLPDI